MSHSQNPKTFPEILDGISDVIDDAHLLPDESQADFDLLKQSVLAEIKPRTLYDKFLTNELTQNLWELRRYRRLRDNLIRRASRNFLRDRLREILRADEEVKAATEEMGVSYDHYITCVVHVWRVEGDEDAFLAEYYLKKHGVSLSEIVADSLSSRTKTLLPLEATIAELVKRCDWILAELDRRPELRAEFIDLATTPPLLPISVEHDDGESP